MGCIKHQEDRATLVPGAVHLSWLRFQHRGRRGPWGHVQALVGALVWEALVEGGNGERDKEVEDTEVHSTHPARLSLLASLSWSLPQGTRAKGGSEEAEEAHFSISSSLASPSY